MTEFFDVIAEFAVFLKTDDVTIDFFNFLESNYPKQWENLNKFYADDYSEACSPRMHLYGWDDLLEPENFGCFLRSMKGKWLDLSGENYGKCEYCKEENFLKTEHEIIVSYDFGPVVKFYEHLEMDGSRFYEKKCCRSCAHQIYQNLASKFDGEKVTCHV